MYEVRIHGRGGQGAVSAAELLSIAAFDAGLVAQAFPSFGSERAGAPVESYCRITESPIRSREPVVSPDAVIILDPTLLHAVNVFAGLRSGGVVLINSSRPPEMLGLGSLSETGLATVTCLPATQIAQRRLGKPLPNSAMLGGFAAATGIVPQAAIELAFRNRFPGTSGEANAAAAGDGFTAAQRVRESQSA